MKRFSFKMLAVASAVCAVCFFGCGGGDDNNPADNNGDNVGNNTGGDNGGDNGGVVDPNNVVNGTFTDNTDDGKTYKTVKIGGQTWMAVNMSKKTADSWCYGEGGYVSSYIEGNKLKFKTLSSSEIQANCNKYGRLYKWDAAKTVCPSGWRLPDTADWKRLFTAVGGDSIAGRKLKSTSGWEWDGTSGNGTDDYGFSALPGGGRLWHEDCYLYNNIECINSYGSVGSEGAWWTATWYGDDLPGFVGVIDMSMTSYDDAAHFGGGGVRGPIYGEPERGIVDFDFASSVRCIKK